MVCIDGLRQNPTHFFVWCRGIAMLNPVSTPYQLTPIDVDRDTGPSSVIKSKIAAGTKHLSWRPADQLASVQFREFKNHLFLRTRQLFCYAIPCTNSLQLAASFVTSEQDPRGKQYFCLIRQPLLCVSRTGCHFFSAPAHTLSSVITTIQRSSS